MCCRVVLALAMALLAARPVAACINDSDTLADEVKARRGMAKAILDETAPPIDRARLEARIARLRSAPNHDDPKWWNELAAAFIRLGDAAEGARLLEGVVERFPNDYAIHANLGTAYHLIGRYDAAAREIRRDLEIDPHGHFDLEPYHLALLEYLAKGESYRSLHLYVDELSIGFAGVSGIPWTLRASERDVLEFLAGERTAASRYPDRPRLRHARSNWERALRVLEDQPAYRGDRVLAPRAQFTAGVLYMAHLNRAEPAAIVMLGVAALRDDDLNLGVRAFERAIAMGSPQRDQLEQWIAAIRDYISESGGTPPPPRP